METQQTNGSAVGEQANGAVKAAPPKKISKLKARDPKTAEPSKPKIMLSGLPGVGKTWGALEFPNVYYLDTEGGANLEHYTDRLKKSGGAYLGPEDGSLDPATVLEQIKALATEDHHYKTLVIDSVSKLYNKIISNEAERLGDKDAFGASKKPAVAFMRRLIDWVDRLPMNVIFITHLKTEWGPGNTGKIGDTFDAWDKLSYELHLWLNIEKRGPSRVAVVRKSRFIGFPEGEAIPWSYQEFAQRYGKAVIEAPSGKIELATKEQLDQLALLLEVMKMSEEEIGKWFSKAKVESWAEMDTGTMEKCLTYLKSKVATKEEK